MMGGVTVCYTSTSARPQNFEGFGCFEGMQCQLTCTGFPRLRCNEPLWCDVTREKVEL
jgi:hypothetical protein